MTKTISFSYEVLNGNTLIAQESISTKLSEKELREVATVMDNNGGHRVELCALEGLAARLEEEIYTMKLPEQLPEETEWENIFVRLQQDMPEELVAAADEFVRLKEVSIPYYVRRNMEEERREAKFGVSPKEYNAMKKVTLSKERKETDFETMKALFPVEYHKVAELVEEWGYKECVRDFGQAFPIALKEFPFEVFINL